MGELSVILSGPITIPGNKLPKYKVTNLQNEEPLGEIRWYSSWRKFVYYPLAWTHYDSSCMGDIKGFLDILMKEYREKEGIPLD